MFKSLFSSLFGRSNPDEDSPKEYSPETKKFIEDFISDANQMVSQSPMPSNIANEPTPGFLAALSDCKKITVKSGQILFHGGRLGKWGNIEELHNNISYEWVSSDKYSARSYAYDKVTMPGLPFLLELELNTDVTAIVASQSQLFKFAQWTLESSNRFAPAEFTKAFTQHASKVVGNEKVIFINVIEMAQLSLNDVLVPFPGKQLKIRNKAILPLK